MSSAYLYIACVLLAALSIHELYRRFSLRRNSNQPSKFQSDSKKDQDENIIPLHGFEWETTEPMQYRPYKSKFNLTMALEKETINDLIQIDKHYKSRIQERKQLIETHFDQVIGAKNERIAKDAVEELYTWLANVYLPKRFPSIFSVRRNPASSQQELWNGITKEWHSLTPGPDPSETLRQLGTIVEDDFFFLLPEDKENNTDSSYTLCAFIGCFPNSFDAPGILGKNLRDFHMPVPGYADKLERSVDRFFRNLPVGKFVSRCNWSLTPYNKLFTPKGHRLTGGTRKEAQAVKLDPDDMFLRAERQVLHRLPKSKAVVFSVRQYIYAVRDIKEEAGGEALAEAIDGLTMGNVPEIYYYKRAAEWGDAVKEYLRS